MSHDFPDGPDYNPEPIDDDPWDVPGTSLPREEDDWRCAGCNGMRSALCNDCEAAHRERSSDAA